MDLAGCSDFVMWALNEFRRFAADNALEFDEQTNSFWIRGDDQPELVQAFPELGWLRCFMHSPSPAERTLLDSTSKPDEVSEQKDYDGWRFHIANRADVELIEHMVLSRCGR